MLSCLDCFWSSACLICDLARLHVRWQVLDMFGSGVPVCAFDFPALDELVKHGENGLVFKTSQELFEQMERLLFPSNSESSTQSQKGNGSESDVKDLCARAGGRELSRLRAAAAAIETWDENWMQHMAPIVQRCLRSPRPRRVAMMTIIWAIAVACLGVVMLLMCRHIRMLLQ